MAKASNWTTVAESKFPWERDALDFLRGQFPAHDPYRAWANFEFIADDGSNSEKGSGTFCRRNLLPERPGGCFAQKAPDPFSALCHLEESPEQVALGYNIF